jgi:hypothetical protein
MKLKKLGLIEYESAFKAMKEKVDKGLTENEYELTTYIKNYGR